MIWTANVLSLSCHLHVFLYPLLDTILPLYRTLIRPILELKSFDPLSCKSMTQRIKHQLMTTFKILNNDTARCFEHFLKIISSQQDEMFSNYLYRKAELIYQNLFTCGVTRHWSILKSSEIKIRFQKMFQNNINKYFNRAKIRYMVGCNNGLCFYNSSIR